MRGKSEAGSNIIEMALVLPLLLIVLFGIVEFSLALYDKAMITNASREGARAGIVFSTTPITDGQIQGVVDTYLANHLITFSGSTAHTTDVIRSGAVSGSSLSIRVNYTYHFLILPAFLVGDAGGIPMTAETIMRME